MPTCRVKNLDMVPRAGWNATLEDGTRQDGFSRWTFPIWRHGQEDRRLPQFVDPGGVSSNLQTGGPENELTNDVLR